MNTFPERLRRLREKRHLKRCVLSQLCGLNYNAVKRYETCMVKPTADALIALADFFDVSVDYLLGRTENPKKS